MLYNPPQNKKNSSVLTIFPPCFANFSVLIRVYPCLTVEMFLFKLANGLAFINASLRSLSVVL